MMSYVTAKPARPDRYLVDRVGAPDPATSEYFVLDLVQDWRAREAVARLGNYYRRDGRLQLAEDCFLALHETKEAHSKVMAARNPQKQKGGKKEVVHP